jgi:hypothetical protein
MVIIRNNISLLIWCIALLLSPVGTVRERERERETETETETLGIGAKGKRDLGSNSSQQWLLLVVPNFLVFFCYLGNFVKPPKPAHPQQKKEFCFCCKNTCHYLHPNKNNISFPSFSLSLSLSLSPPKQGKGPPKFLGQFPKSQVHPIKNLKRALCCIELTVIPFSRFPFLSFCYC